jgi:hypothetical protein
VLEQDVFDLAGLNILGAGDDHVLDTILDIEVSLLVEEPASPVCIQPPRSGPGD